MGADGGVVCGYIGECDEETYELLRPWLYAFENNYAQASKYYEVPEELELSIIGYYGTDCYKGDLEDFMAVKDHILYYGEERYRDPDKPNLDPEEDPEELNMTWPELIENFQTYPDHQRNSFDPHWWMWKYIKKVYFDWGHESDIPNINVQEWAKRVDKVLSHVWTEETWT